MKKEAAIKLILQSAKIFETNLENRNFMFIFKDIEKKTHCFEAAFYPRNFLHLTGVQILNPDIGSSSDFYNICIKNELSLNDFEMAKDGTTEMKLSVLPRLMQIHKNAKMVGEYNSFNIKLRTEKLAGTVTASLGFVYENGYFIPNTALKEDIRDITIKPQQKIIAIYSKDIGKEIYCELRYLAKGITPKTLILPYEIYSKIDEYNLILDF